MNSAAFGTAYSLWLQTRWALCGVLAVLLIVAAGIQLFPRDAHYWLCGTLVAPMMLAHMLTVFTYGPADLVKRQSSFPSYMLVLPTSNRALVGWPMLCGAATHALLWVLFATLVLIPSGLSIPVLWPAAMAAACTAWIQAISWSSYPSPFARIPALAAAIVPLVLLGGLAGTYLESAFVSTFVTACAVLWTLGAYLFGVRGLARSRRGDEGAWFRWLLDRGMAWVLSRSAAAENVRPAFRSAIAAQLWHECRRNAVYLPIMLAIVGVPLLAINCFGILQGDSSGFLLYGSTVIKPAMLGVVVLIGMPLMFGMLLGPGIGKFDIWGKEEMASFFAIRPLTNLQFVLVKMGGAAIGVLMMWFVAVALLAIWAGLEASPLNPHESLVRAVVAAARPEKIALGIAVLLSLVGFTWLNVVSGMWVSLAGRKWLPIVISVAGIAALGVGILAGNWVYKHPEVRPQLLSWLPWLVVTLVALKLCAAIGVVDALRKQHEIELGAIRTMIIVWAAVAGVLLAIACYFTPPTWMLAAGVILFVPFARITAAPLTLHWNRHR